MTKGEYRVDVDFNPSGYDMVGKIKRAAADLIDLIGDVEDSVPSSHDEVNRLKALAQTAIEEGAMWGVKAATKRAPT